MCGGSNRTQAQVGGQTPHSMKGTSRVVVSGACNLVAAGNNVSGDRWYQIWNLTGPPGTESKSLTEDTQLWHW